MSLINDALKRASARASAPANPDLPAGIPVLQPAPDQKRGSALPILALAALAAVLVAAFFLMRGQPAETLAKAPAQPAPPPPKSETVPAAAAPASALAGSLQRAAAVADRISAQNTEGAAVAASVVVATEPPPQTPAVVAVAPASPPPRPAPQTPAAATVAPNPAPAAPAFKLQAIFYRMNNPSAVIDGKTVRKGDTVRGAKILDIQRNAVELELSGARQTLSLK